MRSLYVCVTTILLAQACACSSELTPPPIRAEPPQGVTAPPAETPQALYQGGITARSSALIDPNPSTYLHAPTAISDEASGYYKDMGV